MSNTRKNRTIAGLTPRAMIRPYRTFAQVQMGCAYVRFRNSAIDRLITAISVVLLCATSMLIEARAEAWNGIYPLKTSRVEVERKLGKCKGENNNSDRCLYSFDNKNVIIHYVDLACPPGIWNVNIGTVQSIVIHFGSATTRSKQDLNFDLTGFTKEEDQELDGIFHYTDNSKGLYFVEDRGIVTSIYFKATLNERTKFSCEGRSQNAKAS